jgi:uncharacterized protein YbjT (DUF2867 family)
MAPTILIIGATGNTGKIVVKNLPKLLQSSNTTYRVLGLTRSIQSPASQKLAELPNVEMLEKDWTTIDAAWLKSQDVVRAYIAPHNLPHQFVEESSLHLSLLNAGVKYVVRISTSADLVSPTSPVFYGRSHWAIEELLSQPEFKNLQWTSLQPNLFTTSYLASAVEWIKKYQKTGEQEKLPILIAAEVPVAIIDPEDVGNFGAYLLALDDPTTHNHGKYVLSGPEDVTGKLTIKLVEKYAGGRVETAKFKDTTLIKDLGKAGIYPEKLVPSIVAAFERQWQGKCSLAETPTSKEVLSIAPPKLTVEDALKAMLKE